MLAVDNSCQAGARQGRDGLRSAGVQARDRKSDAVCSSPQFEMLQLGDHDGRSDHVSRALFTFGPLGIDNFSALGQNFS